MRSICLSGVVLVLLACGNVSAEDKKADPREKPETAVAEGIRLLEKKEYKKFVESFVAPEDLKKITKDVSVDDFAKKFGEGKAEVLLKVLKAVKDSKPTLDKDEKKATFKFTEKIEDAPRDTLTFKKVGKYWYIQN